MSFLQLSAAQKLAPSAASMPQGSACCVPCCRLLACSSVAACLVLGVAARIAIDLTNLARGMHRATESVAAQAQAYAGRSNSGAPDAIVFSIGDEKGEARRAYSRLLILRSGDRCRHSAVVPREGSRVLGASSRYAVPSVVLLVHASLCRIVTALLGLLPAKCQVRCSCSSFRLTFATLSELSRSSHVCARVSETRTRRSRHVAVVVTAL